MRKIVFNGMFFLSVCFSGYAMKGSAASAQVNIINKTGKKLVIKAYDSAKVGVLIAYMQGERYLGTVAPESSGSWIVSPGKLLSIELPSGLSLNIPIMAGKDFVIDESSFRINTSNWGYLSD